jgi:uncharacterized protein
MSDFDSRILDEVAHRPWPMPDSAWLMTQTWNDLLFAHWKVDPQLIASKIPAGLTLDLFHGDAWLGIVPFHMTNVAPRFVPNLPWMSAFPELNVRTYVRVGDKPGVYFFSLDAANAVAVRTARALFHLPYFSASMHVEIRDGMVDYESHRKGESAPADFAATYGPVGKTFIPEPGSLDYFLTERYCLYTIDDRAERRRVDIHHPPWLLQHASITLRTNTMTAPLDIPLPKSKPLVHFAKRQDAVAWGPTPV